MTTNKQSELGGSDKKWSKIVTKQTVPEIPIITEEISPPVPVPKKKTVKDFDREWAHAMIGLPDLIPTPAFLRRKRYHDYDKFVPLTNDEIEYEEMCEEIRADIEYWDKKYEQKNQYVYKQNKNEEVNTNENIINTNAPIESDEDSNYDE